MLINSINQEFDVWQPKKLKSFNSETIRKMINNQSLFDSFTRHLFLQFSRNYSDNLRKLQCNSVERINNISRNFVQLRTSITGNTFKGNLKLTIKLNEFILTYIYSVQQLRYRLLMGNDKINQLLRERKIKNRKVAHYRKQRIIKHYKKSQQEQPINRELQQDQASKRKIDFYQKVFDGPSLAQKPKQKQQKVEIAQQEDKSQQKLEKLKERKKHFIKKMHQKTSKGQPLMRNYIKYALTKLQETLQKEKIGKKSK